MILLHNALLLTMCDGERTPHRGAIAIKDDKIVQIIREGEPIEGEFEEQIDCGGKLLIQV